MPRTFITGSADGLGRATAQTLLAQGHQVVVHARSQQRLDAVRDLLDRGALAVVGDLSDLEQTRSVADQANQIGRFHTIIHNAGVYSGPDVLPVNVVAPYVLTALVAKPRRMVYLSSSMHLGGHPNFEGLDWMGQRVSASYSDSKLFVTTLAAAIARLWSDVITSSVDPGWVPTRMGGPNAPDDLRLGHLTQEWLATSDAAEAVVTGGYWHHQRRMQPHSASLDVAFQDALLERLEQATGIVLPVN
jgi:NAD(P)-dependent dehydrogenase (short-subunit alcohol dehydrogenase family)